MLGDQPKTAAEALLSFVKRRTLWNVAFTFDNSAEKIIAQQICLQSRSPVFDSMFRGRGLPSETVELKIKDFKPEVFRKFIEFFYSDKLDVNPVEALHLYQLGRKYKVQPLMEKCEILMREKLPVEHAVEMYEAAGKYGYLDLKTEATNVILRSLGNLLQGPQLLSANEATLIELLVRDDLRVREVDLFRFVVRWGQKKDPKNSNLPKVLGRLLGRLRFTNMSPEEFTTVVMPTKLIRQYEALKIYSYFTGDQSTRSTMASRLKYSTACRCGKLDEMLDFYEKGPTSGANEQKKSKWHQGFGPLRECISFKVLGVTSMKRTCPHFIYNSHSKVQLDSIKIQWPSLLSRGGNGDHLVNVFILKKRSGKGEFQEVTYASAEGVTADCPREILIDPPVEISDKAEYCIAVYDELYFEKSTASVLYRYSSESPPWSSNPKSSVLAGRLTNLEIQGVRRNDFSNPDCYNSGYSGIHVIRGMRLEFIHNNSGT